MFTQFEICIVISVIDEEKKKRTNYNYPNHKRKKKYSINF